MKYFQNSITKILLVTVIAAISLKMVFAVDFPNINYQNLQNNFESIVQKIAPFQNDEEESQLVDTVETNISEILNSFTNFMSAAVTKNEVGSPGSDVPVNGEVSPNFSGLITGGGPSASGALIKEDSSFVASSGVSPYSFVLDSQNASGAGIVTIAEGKDGYGMFGTAQGIGIYGESKDIGTYANGNSIGISATSQNIGVSAISTDTEGSGLIAMGENVENSKGMVAKGKDFGVLGYGLTSGVIGNSYQNGNDIWGALGYSKDNLLYGIYTSGILALSDTLTSDGTLDFEVVGQVDNPDIDIEKVSIAQKAELNSLVLNTWDSNEATITWDSYHADLASYLIGNDETDMSVNSSGQDGGILTVQNGIFRIESGNIRGNDKDFSIQPELYLYSNDSLYADGKITVEDNPDAEIGRFYFVESNEGSNVTASCNIDQPYVRLVGCSGQVMSGEGTIQGAIYEEPATCLVKTSNSLTKARAYAYCFNPEGIGESDEITAILNSDDDVFPDFQDNCPYEDNLDQLDGDKDGIGDACDTGDDKCPSADYPGDQALDGDGDGVGDACDNCASTSNSDQTDSDLDGYGDACDTCEDQDGDGRCDSADNCPADSNSNQSDGDGDKVGDACDNCVAENNADQFDFDRDGVGDSCDNCAYNYNPTQTDQDSDAFGDACDPNNNTQNDPL